MSSTTTTTTTPVVRKASHAGSWYTDSSTELDRRLQYWLNQATYSHGPARAIIAPHAGYRYSGECAAHAYKQIEPGAVKRVFILGPSHHVGTVKCALTQAHTLKTPLYDLKVDVAVVRELAVHSGGAFEWLTLEDDEREHSIEMHLPYVAKVMEGRRDAFTVVPVVVGSLSREAEVRYGRIFAQYLQMPENLFVISSDFCHWGRRFRYTYLLSNNNPVDKTIEELDKMGMAVIERLDGGEFAQYLREHRNTICGRHAIGVLLEAVQEVVKSGGEACMKFLKYAQSNRCKDMSDSSVSYAAGALVFEWVGP